MFISSDEIDRRLGWKPGKAERLARQRRLPHYLLPDGSLRFVWPEIEPLIVRVPETEFAVSTCGMGVVE
jgi:hypothetical protein